MLYVIIYFSVTICIWFMRIKFSQEEKFENIKEIIKNRTISLGQPCDFPLRSVKFELHQLNKVFLTERQFWISLSELVGHRHKTKYKPNLSSINSTIPIRQIKCVFLMRKNLILKFFIDFEKY